jgi:DNA-binding NtrC family response regulator
LEPFKNVIKTAGHNAERKAILKALEETGGNKTKAAGILGISRSSLYNKICDFGIGKSL